MIAGPALGGLVVAAYGVEWAYALDTASFGASLLALALMRAVPAAPDAQKPSLRGIAQGARYAFSRQELLGMYVVDMAAMFFAMPTALFPAVAADVLHEVPPVRRAYERACGRRAGATSTRRG